MKFNYCWPDANHFKDLVKLKSLNKMDIERVDLDHGISYWVLNDVFKDDGFNFIKDVIGSFPIQKDNTYDDVDDSNPFDTIHLPLWAYQDVCFMLRDLYVKSLNIDYTEHDCLEWGNIFQRERSKPIKAAVLPHTDYPKGIIGNLWLDQNGSSQSGTKLYHYRDKFINGKYQFMVDSNHKLHNQYVELLNEGRADSWFNFSDKELDQWGFDYVGFAPTEVNTITVYKANVCHSPFIPDDISFRWSHTFAFVHD